MPRKRKQEGGNEKKPPENKPKQDENKRTGRNSKYYTHIEPYLDAIKGMMRSGATIDDLAAKFEVNRATLFEYKKRHPDFGDALKNNAEIADFVIENALYEMAKTDKVAAFFWLKNRQSKRWRDKQHVFQQSTQITKKDYDNMTDEELEREHELMRQMLPGEEDETSIDENEDIGEGLH